MRWLRRVRGGRGEDDGGVRELNAVRAALDAGLQATDIEHVVPVIIPREYLERGNYPGPADLLRHRRLALAWAVLHAEAMVYVNFARAAAWEGDGIDWKARALANLDAMSADLWTHEKRDGAEALQWVTMLHEDGLGSSRLLLAERLREALGGEYRVGLPDRSCALAVPLSAGEAVVAEVGRLVAKMQADASTPMLGELLWAGDLVVA